MTRPIGRKMRIGISSLLAKAPPMAISSPTSLSFLQTALPPSQKLPFPPNLLTLRPQIPRFLVLANQRTRGDNRTARHARIRKKVEGTPERPRMCVYRSNKHIYVQVIDDTKMHTLASASTMQKPLSEELEFSSGPTVEIAQKIGEAIAKSCLEKGITKVAFDRGGYPYHGRVQALANAARENGLEF